jgi:hypothetical protein
MPSRSDSDRSEADRARDRAAIASIAALMRWGRPGSDTVVDTAPARTGFAKKWLDEADPDRVLPEAERFVKAERLRRAHFKTLALKSAQARRARKSGADPSTADKSGLS